MPRLMTSIEVKVPTRTVRDYIWDAHNLPNFLPVSDVEVLEQGERRHTLRYGLRTGAHVQPVTCVSEVDEAGRKIRLHAVDGPPLEETWVLQDIKGATQVTHIVDYETRGGFFTRWLQQGRTRKEMNRLCCSSLEKLRDILEAA